LLCVHGQFLAVLGHLGMLGHQSLAQLQGLAIGFFRVGQSTGGLQQVAQVVVRAGQFLAVFGHLGMLGHQSLAQLQGLAMGFFRVGHSTGVFQQHAQVVVRHGQVLAVLGHLGMLGHQSLAQLQGLAIGFFRVGHARPVACSKLPRLLCVLARSWRYAGTWGCSATRRSYSCRAWR
jgi:hypothetical protein